MLLDLAVVDLHDQLQRALVFAILVDGGLYLLGRWLVSTPFDQGEATASPSFLRKKLCGSKAPCQFRAVGRRTTGQASTACPPALLFCMFDRLFWGRLFRQEGWDAFSYGRSP